MRYACMPQILQVAVCAVCSAPDSNAVPCANRRVQALAQSCLSPFKNGHFDSVLVQRLKAASSKPSGIAKPAKAPKSASKAKVGQMMAPAKEKKDCFVPSLWPR